MRNEHSSNGGRQLRVLYAAGPGNITETYRHWQTGQDDPGQMALTYSGQFFDVMAALNARGYAISSRFDPQYQEHGNFIVEHRPVPFRNSPNALLYHLGQIWYGLGIIASAVRFRADVAIVVEGSTHLFLMTVLPWLGIETIPLLQCVLWQKYQKPSRLQSLILRLSKHLFAKACLATIVVANEIGDQVREIAGGKARPIARIFPVYRPERFLEIPAPVRQSGEPFRVLFAGRIEANKGVFDLVAMAQQLRAEGDRNIIFDVCGKGSVLETLKAKIAAAGLEDVVLCHGHCNQEQMRHFQSRSHAIIVPTRTNFVEGFAKSVVEGVMAGRPTIASRVCTDLDYFGGAVLPIEPNDVAAYAGAIARLCDDLDYYQDAQQQCRQYREAFFDRSRGWGEVLRRLLVERSDTAPIRIGTENLPARS